MTFTPTTAFLVGPHNHIGWRGITLNDRTQFESYVVDDFTGFELPALRISAQDGVQTEGERMDPSFHGGRTMTLTGYIRARTYPMLLNMGRALVDTMVDLADSDMLIKVADGSIVFVQPSMTIACRPSDFSMDKQIVREDLSGIFKRKFTMALRAGDPTYKSLDVKTANIEAAFTQFAGRFYDRTYPLEYDTLMDSEGNPASGGNNVVAFNSGNWRAKPVIRFNGPMDGVKLLNTLNGQKIWITEAIFADDYVEVDVANHTITDQNGNDISYVFDTRSDWMWLEGDRNPYEGLNTLSLTVTEFDDGAGVDITWRDTSI